jgi:membrane protein DedA with SNARE-associated domain
MRDWVTHTLHTLGYPGIVGLMVVENVFPPIPSELIMPLAGFMTTQGQLSFVGVVLAGMLGSVLGALPLYAVGWLVGEAQVKAWANTYGTWLMVSGQEVERAKGWLERHGRTAVFLCRLVPGVRSLISIPAGFVRMPFTPFLLYTALGTGVWAALLAYVGRLLGERYGQVQTYLGPVAYLVLGVLTALWMIRVVKRKTSGAATGEGPAESQGVCSPRPNPWVWTGDAGDVRFGTGRHASRRRFLAMCS